MKKNYIPGQKYLLIIVSLILHLATIGLIIYLIRPIVTWYLQKIPARGIDLYLSVSYVSHLLKHFAFRFNGWKEIWFAGVPYAEDYPSYYFYLMLPFAKYFGLVPGVQRFAVAGLFVFSTSSYLLYYQLSKNRILAFFLTLATLFSANLYRALVWAGGIPFWTTQAFFPTVMFLISKYCQTQKRQWFLIAVLAASLGIAGHPQNFLNVIFPSVFLILLLYRPGKLEVVLKKRLTDLIVFFGLVYLIALPGISQLFSLGGLIRSVLNIIVSPFGQKLPVSTGGAAVSIEAQKDIEAWTRAQFQHVWVETNQLIWYFLVVGAVLFFFSLLFRKKRLKTLVLFVPFGAIFGLVIGLVFLYSRGIDVYVTGWYKAFWPVLVGGSTLAAFFWGEAKKAFIERKIWQKKAVRVIRMIGVVVVNIALIGGGYYFLLPTQEKTLEKLETIDQFSSAFPEILNVKTGKEDLMVLKEKLKPKLMIDDPKDYRLYVIDATVNIWWGALEDVPLARGYVDPPLSTEERWGLFWLDSSLGPTDTGPKSSLIEDWDTPEGVADNNVRFLLDWNAIKYLEGNHLSASNSFFASNIIAEKFIEAEEIIETQGGVINRYKTNESWSNESKQYLKFFRVKNEVVSPILTATDAVPVLHIGGEDGYDTLTRYLGMMNLGPRKIILARGPKYIDKVSFSDLKNFEAVVLYKYDYQNYDKAWNLIGKFVENGGRVFIDTGPEVKESDTTKLPAKFPSELPGIFPFKRTIREDMGKFWQPMPIRSKITKGIDFDEFSPLIFNGDVWNVSHPVSSEDLREDAEVILRHKGIPVVAQIGVGEGKVVWSGFNLPYHVIRDYNFEEGKFFKNLLVELIDLEEKPVLTKGSFISSRERLIEVKNAKGVVFKEQAFGGWQASHQGRRLKIYKVGPSSPGFMYVRLPEDAQGQLEFKYKGTLLAWIYSLISFLTIVLILDSLFGGRILIALSNRGGDRLRKHVGKWWDKEDEY